MISIINQINRKKVIRSNLFLRYLLSSSNNNRFNTKKNVKKIVVALAADYGNLGDVAITYAQTEFLKKQFPDYEVLDFPINETFTSIKALKKIINKQDIITIVGGGNTGDMYDDIEYCRQFIIKQFPMNKIISFPQTIDFSDTESGRKALKRAIEVYGCHKDLTLSAREDISFKKYKEYFPSNKVLFLPDIVLSLNEESPVFDREGITLCLRSDGEKRIDRLQEKLLIEKLSESYNIKYYDTHINRRNLSVKEREFELEKIWTAFKKSRIVITDRLHGMIFCAITKTPCIALDNSNHKISGVYNAWLENLGYIKMIKEYDLVEMQTYIELLWNFDSEKYESPQLLEKFKTLV